jgi:drug/metabolite transporter (DMT)-like permease
MFCHSDKLKGTALMVTACAFFCVMASLVKLVLHVDAFKIGLWRFVIGMGLLGTAALFGRIQLKFHNWKLLFVRGLLGGAGIVIMYFAIVNLGMSKGMVLVSTYPIFAYIFSIVLLKERPSMMSALLIAAAFAGICLVVGGNSNITNIFESFGLYEILAVSVGVIGGLCIVTIRKLHETDSSYAIYFSQCAIGFGIAVVPAGAGSSRIGFADALILVLIGVTATVGQLMMTQSYKHLPVRMGAMLAMLEPVFCYLAGVALFGELFSAKSVIGTLLIISSCVAALLRDGRPENLTVRVVERTEFV